MTGITGGLRRAFKKIGGKRQSTAQPALNHCAGGCKAGRPNPATSSPGCRRQNGSRESFDGTPTDDRLDGEPSHPRKELDANRNRRFGLPMA